MIVKCIDDKSEEYPNFRGKPSSNKVVGLTKDKSYEVEQSKQYDDYFEILNDLGIKESYKKERFEVMEDILIQCLNKNCELNKNEVCTGIETNLYKLNCVGRINPQHTPSYAEEQLEYAIEKETRCYNELCNRNDKNGSCRIKEKYYVKNCTSRDIEKPVLINYEEEYEKLKEENESLYNENLKYLKEKEELAGGKKFLECIIDKTNLENKELKSENDRMKKEIEEGYQCIENEYENKLFLAEQKADKTINELKKENERLNSIDSEYCQLLVQNGDLQKENEELKAEINQLRGDIQQSNFKLKEYESKLPQLKELVVKLIRINEILASNIYVEGMED